MKSIKLSGKSKLTVLVDDEDYIRLSQHRWYKNTYYNYVQANIGGKSVRIHRFIMDVLDKPQMEIDHKNGDGLDNRKENLRFATRSQNCQNSPKRRGGTSKYKGVSFRNRRKKWKAQTCNNGKTIYLGCYKTEEDAARAYNKYASENYGEFARLNIIEEVGSE